MTAHRPASSGPGGREIDVAAVLEELPSHAKFPSVADLHALADSIARDVPALQVRVAGTSTDGLPIHHIRAGSGSVRALVVAFTDCMEPMGGLTVTSLLDLLSRETGALLEADIEWHIVPCADPDGAVLNEGWTQSPFSLEAFMEHYYVPAAADRLEATFPVDHKKLVVDEPSTETAVLQRLLDRIRPDFFFPLHNAIFGGAYYYLNHDIGDRHYQSILDLLEQHSVPVQRRPLWKEVCAKFADGFYEGLSARRLYDHLEKTMPDPERVLRSGTGSWDYLAEIKPEALAFVPEMGYVTHPDDESDRPTGQNLRKFMLLREAETRHLGALLLEVWDAVKDDLDPTSPYYRAIDGGAAFPTTVEDLHSGGMPMTRWPTRDLLLNPSWDRPMTVSDRFNACMIDGGFLLLFKSHQLLRLLERSSATPAVVEAIERLERAYDDALADLKRHVDFESFQFIGHDAMARVQLGSGLIALNSILTAKARPSSTGPVTTAREETDESRRAARERRGGVGGGAH